MTDYTLPNPLSDILLVCKDDVRLHYSKWLLGTNCIALKPALEDTSNRELQFNDYNGDIVTYVLRWIDGDKSLPKTIETIRFIYEFAHQYQFPALELYMDKVASNNPSIRILDSLHQRKSKNYVKGIHNFINFEKYSEYDADLYSVPRFILTDIITEHRKIVNDYNKALDSVKQTIVKLDTVKASIESYSTRYSVKTADKAVLDTSIASLKTIQEFYINK